jgi:F-type H+-transporting ATPase subunit delta
MDRPLGSARRYASALLGIAGDAESAAALSAELDRAAAVVASPGARALLDDPRAAASQRVAALEKAAGGTTSAALHALYSLLANRRRLSAITPIAEAVHEALDHRNGVTVVRAASALPLATNEQNRVEGEARQLAGGAVRMEYSVDGDLIGGITLRVGDRLIDGSVKGRLARMRERILSVAG